MTGAVPELCTQRLVLRQITMEDAPAFFSRVASNGQVVRYLLWPAPHASVQESEASIEKAIRRCEAGQAQTWAITLADSGEFIGRIDLLGFDADKKRCSFAYLLGEGCWNRGYGTEAVRAVFDFAFRELGVECIEADHFSENPASGAVMAKAGMTCLGVIPGKYEKGGVRHDAVRYRITKEEWENR